MCTSRMQTPSSESVQDRRKVCHRYGWRYAWRFDRRYAGRYAGIFMDMRIGIL